MPIPRQFGQEIDGNTRRGPNISPDDRGAIIALRECGVSVSKLATRFGRSEHAIRYTLQTYTSRPTTEERPRSGRPTILSRHQQKLIYRAARKTPKIEYRDLQQVAVVVNPDTPPPKPPSRSTLYRYLKRQGLTNYRTKHRPKLNQYHATKRLQFSYQYRTFQWSRRTVKFSDECSVQKGSGHNQEWVFRFPSEKWKRAMLTTLGTGRKPAQMVWASIWLDERGQPRRSQLVITERDPDAPRGGYTSKSYIKALTEGLLPHYRRSQLFMQDNAGIHTSRAAQSWLADHHITTLPWPPYSPDLNPIEHLW